MIIQVDVWKRRVIFFLHIRVIFLKEVQWIPSPFFPPFFRRNQLKAVQRFLPLKRGKEEEVVATPSMRDNGTCSQKV